MLTPITGAQSARLLTKAEKQKDTTSAQNTVTGQKESSPLSKFLNSDEMNALIPRGAKQGDSVDQADQADQNVQPSAADELVEITEEMESSATQIDQAELVAELLETVPDLQINEEQLDVFSPISTDGADGSEGDSAVKNLVEAVVETLTETPVDTLVSTFVETEDIAKLVSSKAHAWTHVGLKMVEKTIMLLKNGMAYTDLTTPPGDLEIPTSLETAGPSWTSWRQDEETGAIYLGSEGAESEERLSGVEIDLEPLSIADIAGTHTKVEAESWSATHETRWSDIVFHEDGTFEYARTTVRTTGGYDTHWLNSFTQSATYVSANRPTDGTDGASNDESNGPPNTNMFGSFSLAEDGLSIELTYADGSVESRLMYKSDGYVHFGESSFKTRHETMEELASMREKIMALTEDEAVLGADWLAVLAESAAAANDKRGLLTDLIYAPRNSPRKG